MLNKFLQSHPFLIIGIGVAFIVAAFFIKADSGWRTRLRWTGFGLLLAAIVAIIATLVGPPGGEDTVLEPDHVAPENKPTELEAMRQRLKQLTEPLDREHLSKEDWLGAGGIFLLVFLSTFPVVIPFIVMHDGGLALRISNGIAILMLFMAGYAYGKCVDRRPWLMGVSMVALGSVLVGLTMALGG